MLGGIKDPIQADPCYEVLLIMRSPCRCTTVSGLREVLLLLRLCVADGVPYLVRMPWC